MYTVVSGPVVYQCRLTVTLTGRPIIPQNRGPWTNCTKQEYDAKRVHGCRGRFVVLAGHYEFRILAEVVEQEELAEA